MKSSDRSSATAHLHVGILRTDTVMDRFQAAHGDYPAMFEAVLGEPENLPAAAAGASLRFSSYLVPAGEYPTPDTCDAYVITGSRNSVYDDLPWIPELVAFLRSALEEGRKLVGICFGHQLIAHYFGGETRPADSGWCVGVRHTEVLSQEPWMIPSTLSFGLLSSHKDQAIRLPEGARRFASSEACPNAGFVLGDKVLTFQGHPEFTTSYARDLLDMRRELLGPAVYQRGIASLDDAPDNRLVARWILNFICA